MRHWVRIVAHRFRVWVSPVAADEDFDRELESHVQMLADDNVRRGMPPDAALRAARVRVGAVTQLKETNRELNGLPALESVVQDTRFALRALRKNPVFTAAAVSTLALSIGANTAIFSVVYSVLLKPLPYADSDRLFNVFQAKPEDRIMGTGWSYANFADLVRQNDAFSDLAGSQKHQLTLTGRTDPAVVDASVVTAELFALFRQLPIAGRAFLPEDGKRGAPAVAILSESLWRGSFGGDPQVLGTTIRLDQRPFTIVGVMPGSFRFPSLTKAAQVWIPVAQDPLFGEWMERRGGHWLQVTGRLKPGVSQAQAQERLDAITARLAVEFPGENAGWHVRMVPLQDMIVNDVKAPLFVLLAAAGVVLLIACANVANLLLTRASGRAREIAVRSALGAGRSRIVRQLLSESVVLGLLGCVLGLLLAYWGVQTLGSLLPASVPQVNTIAIDRVVLAFAIALSLLSSTLFGLAPAWFTVRSSPATVLREGGARTGESRGRRHARAVLAAAEIALAIVLLVGAGLLLQSFANMTSVSPGFNPERLVTADISLPRFQYSMPQQWTAFADAVLAGLHGEPGVSEVAVAVPRPIVDGSLNFSFDIVGRPALSSGVTRTANYVSVTPEYLRVMGIPLVSGRFFDQHDVPSSVRVSVISQVMARMYFPNENPIGKKIVFGFPPDANVVREVVGVVGDVRDVALGQDPGPMMYVPYAQAPFWGANVVVRSALSPADVATAIRRHVHQIDSGLPVSAIAVMPDVINASLAAPKFRTLLLGLFAVIALLLAASGIFGAISYSVSCRTNEIGIRVALGASRAAVLGMISRETAALTLAGIAVGVPSAVAVSRLVAHMLFGVSPRDPLTIGVVIGTLLSVSALAAYIPARRALRISAMDALRHD
jgi:predicted permease